METLLKLNRLHKSYGETPAVDGLDLEVRRGEIFGLLGPNGAGKSTAVALAVGLLKPDEGTVDLVGFGSPVQSPVRRHIGVAPQALAIYEEMSGLENLRFFGRLQGLSGKELSERAHWALDFVGLSQRAGDLASTYSGGMKRRLNLAAAIVHRPRLLLLDEPTVGVDPQSRNSIFENILRLRSEGATVVYTTHYMEEAQRLCDRVGIIDKGKLLALDSVENLTRQHGGDSWVRAERRSGEEVSVQTSDPLSHLRRLLDDGEELLRVSVERPNLETVFLNLTGRQLRD
ncbi:MAG TPA: ABC transporter ATP-binding protein [Acidobacteriota bacterium]|nr:ABC transporter ATP-binding protein [Acidobacteriota bacterium]